MLGRDDSGRPERQSPIIDRELHQYHVDVAALSEITAERSRTALGVALHVFLVGR